MKLAILADIHANLVALETVTAHIETWQPDQVIVAGDVVNRGPRPRECLRLVQAKQQTDGWLVVRGNHEDYVISHAEPDAPRAGPSFEMQQHAYWTYCQLNGQVPVLKAMPFQRSLTAPDGGEVRFTHASMTGIRDGIYPETGAAELRRKIAPPPAVLCVGHTHRPLIRRLDQTLVVNVGSAGLPFDGDPRPSYAQLEWRRGRWQARLVRLDYARQQAERDFFVTDFCEGSGPLADLILDELRTAQSRLFQWTAQYQDLILAGKITMAESTRQFLANLDGR
ncbi:MAG: metallophosphoesterase family protein [Chloroflexota bacterium]